MELNLGPEAARFRAEIRAWIEANAPAGLTDLVDWTAPPLTGGARARAYFAAEADPLYAEWERRLLGAKLICPRWPARFGGRGLTPVQDAIYSEECHRAGVPRVRRHFGENMVGPSVLAHGTDEQRDHFLPKIVSGEHVYCQGFSEPDHGSDLAGVQARGVIEGDEIVITGQKVWTSAYARANMIFVLCRTSDESKHGGLSYPALTLGRRLGASDG